MDATTQKIMFGSKVCQKIKRIYFKESAWVDSYRDVADKFTILKKRARHFYAGMDDLELHKTLSVYSEQDIIDAFGEP